jgi:hypothetical protein
MGSNETNVMRTVNAGRNAVTSRTVTLVRRGEAGNGHPTVAILLRGIDTACQQVRLNTVPFRKLRVDSAPMWWRYTHL